MRSSEFAPVWARVAAGLDGEVLEIGFGSGLNLPHYPDRVVKILAIDPAVAGRKLAAGRIAACPVPIQFAGSTPGHCQPRTTALIMCSAPGRSAPCPTRRRQLLRSGEYCDRRGPFVSRSTAWRQSLRSPGCSTG